MTKISPTSIDIERFVGEHPTRGGESWAGWGGSFIYQLFATSMSGIYDPRPYASVALALRHTKILSADPTTAPTGAIHWWQAGPSQNEYTTNAGVDLDGGGMIVYITSGYPLLPGQREAGDGLRMTSVDAYTRSHPNGGYVGWSLTYGEPRFPEHEKLSGVAPATQAIDEFLEFVLQEYGYCLAFHDEESGRLVPISKPVQDMLAEFSQIDQRLIEVEKRAMLELFRATSEVAG